MIRTLDSKTVVAMALMLLTSCQKLKPEQIVMPEYPDLNAFYEDQIGLLDTSTLEKEVSLDEKTETTTFKMDTSRWKDELAFLEEINPNQPEYVGAFEKSGTGNQKVFTLKNDEKGVLKRLSIFSKEGNYSSIMATIHEEKDVYTHHREIELKLTHGIMQSYRIDGYQKMMFKDTVRFSVAGTVSK